MKPFSIVNVWLLTFEPILLLQVHRTICIFLSFCAPHYSLNYTYMRGSMQIIVNRRMKWRTGCRIYTLSYCVLASKRHDGRAWASASQSTIGVCGVSTTAAGVWGCFVCVRIAMFHASGYGMFRACPYVWRCFMRVRKAQNFMTQCRQGCV